MKLFNLILILALLIATFGCKKDSTTEPYLTLGLEALSVAKAGGNLAFAVLSNTAWTVELPTDANWIAGTTLSGSNFGNAVITQVKGLKSEQSKSEILIGGFDFAEYISIGRTAWLQAIYFFPIRVDLREISFPQIPQNFAEFSHFQK